MRKIFLSVLLCILAVSAFANVKDDIKDDMAAKRWVAADAKLVKVLKEHPNNAVAHYWMSQVKLHEGLPVLAREHLEKAKQLAPDLSFASSREVVAELERSLSPPVAKAPPGVAFQSRPIGSSKIETPPESGHGFFFWLALIGIPLALVFFFVSRSGKKRQSEAERSRYQLELKDLGNELRDAEKAIDGRAELSAEQKMTLSDRLSQAQGDLAREASTLVTRTDFDATRKLIVRLRDIAAEARGEEKPSLRVERQMGPAGEGYATGNPAAPTGGGLGAGVAGVGGLLAGVALGSLMSGSSHAASRSSSGAEPVVDGFQDAPGSLTSVDFGNDSGSDADWSDSSSDTGGDSGGSDNDW